MNKAAVFFFIVLGVGLFLWLQKDELVVSQSGAPGGSNPGVNHPDQTERRFIIRQKVKPGGYIGWHQSEQGSMTSSARQTRQSSNHYFICTEEGSRVERIFLVPERAFNMERAGNVLTASQMRSFREVSAIEEPPLPPDFEFRRRNTED